MDRATAFHSLERQRTPRAKVVSRGFTIVELLIVIVVIAILAAITIVAYNGIQDRARATALQSDLTNAKKKLILYQVDEGQYPASMSMLADVGVRVSKSVYDTSANNFYYCLNKVTGEFALGARTIAGGAAYVISSIGGLELVGGIDGAHVCQVVGVSDSSNTANAYLVAGYGTATGWAAWTN
jgi:general secretion pathway protein G